MSYEGSHIKVKANDTEDGSFGYKFNNDGGELEINKNHIKLRVGNSDDNSITIQTSSSKIVINSDDTIEINRGTKQIYLATDGIYIYYNSNDASSNYIILNGSTVTIAGTNDQLVIY